MIFYYSSVRLAGVTDGTSNTFLFGEHAYGKNPTIELPDWGWWFSGNYGDTMFTTMFPMNPRAKIPDVPNEALYGIDINPSIQAASSFHPGGAHFALCDGSVRFVKETIDSAPFDTTTGLPRGWSIGAERPLFRDPARSDGSLPGPLDPERRRGRLRRLVLSRPRTRSLA